MSVTTASQCLVGKQWARVDGVDSLGRVFFLPFWFHTDVTRSLGLTAFSSSPVSTVESELDPPLWLCNYIDCPSRSKQVNWLSRKQEVCFDWRGIIRQNDWGFEIDGASDLGLEVKRLKTETLIFLASRRVIGNPDWHLWRFTGRKWVIVMEGISLSEEKITLLIFIIALCHLWKQIHYWENKLLESVSGLWYTLPALPYLFFCLSLATISGNGIIFALYNPCGRPLMNCLACLEPPSAYCPDVLALKSVKELMKLLSDI